MLGSSGSGDQLGVIPTAISWLYRGIGEQKQKSGARFSVRVSAVQIAGAAENLRDLLKDHAKGKAERAGTGEEKRQVMLQNRKKRATHDGKWWAAKNDDEFVEHLSSWYSMM